jgi:hypothetical protein
VNRGLQPDGKHVDSSPTERTQNAADDRVTKEPSRPARHQEENDPTRPHTFTNKSDPKCSEPLARLATEASLMFGVENVHGRVRDRGLCKDASTQ